jgi:CBS domain-containing protein
MSIAQIYVRNVETCKPGNSVVEAARRMHDRKVGTVVIVDEEGKPMGLLSDRDVVTRLVAVGGDPAHTAVQDIMTPMPTSVVRDASIEEALGQMRLGHMRRLPVVDGMDKLVGMITLDDILRHLAAEASDIEHLLQSESPKQHS